MELEAIKDLKQWNSAYLYKKRKKFHAAKNILTF